MRDSEKVPIEAVLLDANYTIFTPWNRTRPALLAKVVFEITGRHVDGLDFLNKSRAIRRAMNAKVSEADQNTDEYWMDVNASALESVGVKATDKFSRAIRIRLLEGTELYTLTRERERFVRWLCAEKFGGSKVSVVTASNSPSRPVERMLARHRIRGLFNGCYSPDLIGSSKPSREYFEEIMERLGVDRPELALMVGNSPLNDLGALAAGLNTLLILDPNEPVDFQDRADEMLTAHPKARFHFCRRLRKAKDWIEENFRASACTR
jgi:FMN phosphatase YigB (HAD superfamily)